MLQKLKSFLANDTLFYGVLLIGVAVASFGLGRQSVLEQTTPKSVEKQEYFEEVRPAPAAPAPTPLSDNIPATEAPSTLVGEVVASKSGSKYHLPTCAGAKQIKPENLISFASAAAAEAAGYTAAANCPGL